MKPTCGTASRPCLARHRGRRCCYAVPATLPPRAGRRTPSTTQRRRVVALAAGAYGRGVYSFRTGVRTWPPAAHPGPRAGPPEASARASYSALRASTYRLGRLRWTSRRRLARVDSGFRRARHPRRYPFPTPTTAPIDSPGVTRTPPRQRRTITLARAGHRLWCEGTRQLRGAVYALSTCDPHGRGERPTPRTRPASRPGSSTTATEPRALTPPSTTTSRASSPNRERRALIRWRRHYSAAAARGSLSRSSERSSSPPPAARAFRKCGGVDRRRSRSRGVCGPVRLESVSARGVLQPIARCIVKLRARLSQVEGRFRPSARPCRRTPRPGREDQPLTVSRTTAGNRARTRATRPPRPLSLRAVGLYTQSWNSTAQDGARCGKRCAPPATPAGIRYLCPVV